MYHVRKKKIKATKQIEELSLQCGKVYSNALITFWRIQRKKGIWLSKYAMQRLIKREGIHSQTAQACIDSFYNSLKTWRALRKSGNKTARPPIRQRKYFLVQYKGQAIKLKDGILTLPNGRKSPSIKIPWKYEKPATINIKAGYRSAEIVACYNTQEPTPIKEGKVAAIDLGQIHLACTSDGWSVSGRKLRALRRYQNKYKSRISSLQSKKSKGSRAWKRLQHTKRKVLSKLNNQISDFTHKATTGIVSTLERTGVKTLVLGDLRGIREDNNQGRLRNQENHQWNFHQISWQLTYKAKAKGMEIAMEKEHYTSSSCPHCGGITKTKTRNFVCSNCKFSTHRDLLGAKNILKKYLATQKIDLPVVGGMTPPRGVRLNSHTAVAGGFAFGNKLKFLETPGF